MKKEVNKVAAIITERILDLLKSGTVPWHKPWKGGRGVMPKSVHGREYRGVNFFILMMAGYSSPYWITFKQALERGGMVRKGERGLPVVFWKFIEVEDANAPSGKKNVGFLRYYTVFNLEQCDGIKPPKAEVPEETKIVDPIEHCEAVVNDMPNPPKISFGGGRACYNPVSDSVRLPERDQFDSSEEYYSTMFHELAHSTGHASRLDRKCLVEHHGFGSENYSKEELVAEMSAAFLCGVTEIENKTINNSAAYIAGWMKRLKEDEMMIVNAGSAAHKAADFILGITPSYSA